MAAIKQQKGSGKKRTKILARKKKKGIGSTGQGNRTKIALRNSRSYKEQLRRKRREEEENRRRRDAEEEEEEE
jgi:phage terminase Nu1 subunit (DNA packaging protein)